MITFNQIVRSGKIEVSSQHSDNKILYMKEIFNTNFEKLNFSLVKGKYRLEIVMDGEYITKTININ